MLGGEGKNTSQESKQLTFDVERDAPNLAKMIKEGDSEERKVAWIIIGAQMLFQQRLAHKRYLAVAAELEKAASSLKFEPHVPWLVRSAIEHTEHITRAFEGTKDAYFTQPSPPMSKEGSPPGTPRSVRGGIPAGSRGIAWQSAIGNMLFITPGQVSHLKQRLQACQQEIQARKNSKKPPHKPPHRKKRTPSHPGPTLPRETKIDSKPVKLPKLPEKSHKNLLPLPNARIPDPTQSSAKEDLSKEKGEEAAHMPRLTADWVAFEGGDSILDEEPEETKNPLPPQSQAQAQSQTQTHPSTGTQTTADWEAFQGRGVIDSASVSEERKSDRLGEEVESNIKGAESHLYGETESHFLSNLLEIDQDICRTHADTVEFKDKGIQEDMRYILQLFVVYRPDIGYTQGMSYLAAQLVKTLRDRYKAFVCLANILCTQSLFRALFATQNILNPKVIARVNLFNILLESNIPELYHHLKSVGITLENTFIKWTIGLFGTVIKPGKTLDVLWDHFLIKGEQEVYRSAIAILMLLKDDLLEGGFPQCVNIMQSRHELKQNEVENAIDGVTLDRKFKYEFQKLSRREAIEDVWDTSDNSMAKRAAAK